jgi:hypothetical protein
MIRALIAVVLAAALGWSAYWFIGARALDREVEAWLEARRAEGWVADVEDTTVRGFPNRFDLTLTGVELADPDTGLAWSAPFFQILALSYRPSHVIAVWPHEQTVSTPFENMTVESSDFRGSLRLADTSTLALENATFVSEAVTVASDAGWTAALGSGRLAARLVPDTPSTYEIGIEALDLTPAETVRRTFDVARSLPDTIETLRLDAEIAFTAPWDHAAIEVARPQPIDIDLRELRATWGRLDLRAAGEVVVAPDGTPNGQVAVKAVNWREMLALGVSSGAVPEGLASAIERGLEALAGASGSPDTLDAKLTFRDGGVYYGFIPLGPAPVLRLR